MLFRSFIRNLAQQTFQVNSNQTVAHHHNNNNNNHRNLSKFQNNSQNNNRFQPKQNRYPNNNNRYNNNNRPFNHNKNRSHNNSKYCSLCGKKDHIASQGCPFMIDDTGAQVEIMPTLGTCSVCPEKIFPRLNHPAMFCPFRKGGPLHRSQ